MPVSIDTERDQMLCEAALVLLTWLPHCRAMIVAALAALLTGAPVPTIDDCTCFGLCQHDMIRLLSSCADLPLRPVECEVLA